MGWLHESLRKMRELAEAPTLGNLHPDTRAQQIARANLTGRSIGAIKAPVFGIADPDYARVFTQARIIAWQYGYACVMHGSFTRDLDLLLVPWEGRAIENHDQLLRLIAQSCGLRFRDGVEDILKAKPDYTVKPHGRKSCSLFFAGPYDRRWVDIGIMPCAAKAEPVAWLHTVTQHGGEGEQDKALSFAPDNFPLQGEETGMFYSIGKPEPLYLRPHESGVPGTPKDQQENGNG